MAKTTTPLTAQERVILFCTAIGVSHAAIGITRARNAVHGHQGIHCPRSRERGLCAYGQRTRCAPCDPRGCGADIDREAAMAAFAKSWRRE